MKKIFFGGDARGRIKDGVDKCVDVVKVSLGNKGKNVLIYNGQTTDIMNDGVSIARQVEVKDETEMAGIILARQCASKTNSEAGDGTTTTLVLLQSLLSEIIDPTMIVDARSLRDALFASTKKVLDELKKGVRKVKSIKDIEAVATTSSLNKDIGAMIAKMFDELGEDASISINETRKEVLEYEVKEGLQFDTENIALYSEEKEVYEDVPVIYMDKKISAADIGQSVETIVKSGMTEIVIIAPDWEKDAIALITQFKMKGNIKIAAIKNKSMNQKDLKELGNKAKRVIITLDTTTVIGWNGDVDKHVDNLKKELEEEESLYERENIEKRISQLTGGVAEMTIGRATDVERAELVLKIEDAINSARNAYKHGVVKGGGIALNDAVEILGYDMADSLVRTMCKAPRAQIVENAEKDEKVSKDVLDSYLVIKTALTNAVSTATSILTAEAALIEIDD